MVDKMKLLKRMLMLAITIAAGYMLQSMRIPIPFLLAGVGVAMVCKSADDGFTWPRKWREYALYAAGFGIGRNFNDNTVRELSEQILGVFESSAIAVAASVVIAVVIAKYSYANLISCVMGSMPGGLTAMMLLAEEDERADFNIVVLMQSLRLTAVVAVIPFLAVHGLGAQIVPMEFLSGNNQGYHWLYALPIAVCGTYILEVAHIPTPSLLGPILASSACTYFIGDFQALPTYVMVLAQASLGVYMGMMLDWQRLKKAGKLLPYIFGGIATMICVSIAVAYYLSQHYGFSLVTGFLAMAPGGIAEMCLAGMSMGENVSVILTYQLVRLMLLNILVPIGIQYYFKKKKYH